jgi:GNAT superfamily N-acetyltransferase
MPLTLADMELLCFDPAIHNVNDFDCDDADLNDFIRTDSQRYSAEYLSHTRIALHNGVIIGYITLLADAIILKSSEKRRLFTFHHQVYTFPALKIGRLGVHRDKQRDGVGKSLLKYAIGVVVRLNQDMNVGCRFITVDAYPKSVSWYQYHGFFFNKV